MAQTRQTKPELIPFTTSHGDLVWVNPFLIQSIIEKATEWVITMNDGEGYHIPKDVGDNNSGINSIE